MLPPRATQLFPEPKTPKQMITRVPINVSPFPFQSATPVGCQILPIEQVSFQSTSSSCHSSASIKVNVIIIWCVPRASSSSAPCPLSKSIDKRIPLIHILEARVLFCGFGKILTAAKSFRKLCRGRKKISFTYQNSIDISLSTKPYVLFLLCEKNISAPRDREWSGWKSINWDGEGEVDSEWRYWELILMPRQFENKLLSRCFHPREVAKNNSIQKTHEWKRDPSICWWRRPRWRCGEGNGFLGSMI